MKNLKDRRKLYGPVLKRFLVSGDMKNRELSGDPDIFIILELIDLGYLDPSAFRKVQAFGRTESVVCRTDPVSPAGMEFLKAEKREGLLKKKKIFAALLVTSAILFTVVLNLL